MTLANTPKNEIKTLQIQLSNRNLDKRLEIELIELPFDVYRREIELLPQQLDVSIELLPQQLSKYIELLSQQLDGVIELLRQQLVLLTEFESMFTFGDYPKTQ